MIHARAIRALLAGLVLIGISEPLGVIFSSTRLRTAGRMSSASNCPLVFNQVDGIEFWANSYAFELRGRDGATLFVPATRDVIGRIGGPHTRTAAFVVPIGLGPVSSAIDYQRPLQFGLCDRGPLITALGYDEPIVEASIRVKSGSPNDSREWRLTIRCDS